MIPQILADQDLALQKSRKKQFYNRMFKSCAFTLVFLLLSLGGGMWGYHEFNHLNWIDSFLDAAMILSGMGPVSPLISDSAKLFAGFYALYSGGAFLIAMAVLLAPFLHYLLKNFEFRMLNTYKNQN